MKKGIVAIGALICPIVWCSANAAEDWVTIPTNASDVTFSIDKASIQRKKNTVRFWEKITYGRPDVIDQASGKLVKEKKVHRIMDCLKNTQSLIYGATFADDGKFITSVSFDESKIKMTAIPRGTLAAEELKLVCGELANKDRKTSGQGAVESSSGEAGR